MSGKWTKYRIIILVYHLLRIHKKLEMQVEI